MARSIVPNYACSSTNLVAIQASHNSSNTDRAFRSALPLLRWNPRLPHLVSFTISSLALAKSVNALQTRDIQSKQMGLSRSLSTTISSRLIYPSNIRNSHSLAMNEPQTSGNQIFSCPLGLNIGAFASGDFESHKTWSATNFMILTRYLISGL